MKSRGGEISIIRHTSEERGDKCRDKKQRKSERRGNNNKRDWERIGDKIERGDILGKKALGKKRNTDREKAFGKRDRSREKNERQATVRAKGTDLNEREHRERMVMKN